MVGAAVNDLAAEEPLEPVRGWRCGARQLHAYGAHIGAEKEPPHADDRREDRLHGLGRRLEPAGLEGAQHQLVPIVSASDVVPALTRQNDVAEPDDALERVCERAAGDDTDAETLERSRPDVAGHFDPEARVAGEIYRESPQRGGAGEGYS